MAFGVPLLPLVALTGVVVLLAVWIHLLIALVWLPAMGVMRAIAKTDDQQFRLLGLKMWCRLLPHRNANGNFWKSSAYSPIAFKKR